MIPVEPPAFAPRVPDIPGVVRASDLPTPSNAALLGTADRVLDQHTLAKVDSAHQPLDGHRHTRELAGEQMLLGHLVKSWRCSACGVPLSA